MWRSVRSFRPLRRPLSRLKATNAGSRAPRPLRTGARSPIQKSRSLVKNEFRRLALGGETEKAVSYFSREFERHADVFDYSSVVRILLEAREVYWAVKCVKKMLARGWQPVPQMVKDLLHAVTDELEAEAVEAVLKDVDLSSESYAELVKYHANRREAEKLQACILEMLVKGVPPDGMTIRLLLRAFRSDGDWEGGFKLLAHVEDKGIFIDAWAYESLARLATELRDVEGVVRILRRVQRRRSPRTAHSCARLIQLLLDLGEEHRAELAADEAADSGAAPAAALYFPLLKHHSRNRAFQRRGDVLERMLSKGIIIDQNCFRALLGGLKKAQVPGSVSQMAQTLVEAKYTDAEGCFSALVQACLAQRDLVAACRALDSALKAAIQLQPATCAAFIQKCVDWNDLDLGYSSACAMIQANNQPPFRACESLIRALGSEKSSEARRVGDLMQAAGYNIDRLSASVDAPSGRGSGENVRRVPYLDLLRILPFTSRTRGAESTAEAMLSKGVAPNPEVCVALLGVVSRKRDSTAVRKAHDRMVASGLKPNLMTWKALIQAYISCQDYVEAANTVAKRVEDGFDFGESDLSDVATRIADGSDAEAVAKIFALVTRYGLSINAAALRAVIKAFAEVGDAAKAYEALDYCFRKCSPGTLDTCSCNAVVEALSRAGEASRAQEVIMRMRRSSVPTSARTFVCALNAHAHRGDVVGMEMSLRGMLKEGYLPDAEVCTTLINGFLAAGDLKGARECLELCQKYDSVPPAIVFQYLYEAHIDGTDLAGAMQIKRSADALGLRVDPKRCRSRDLYCHPLQLQPLSGTGVDEASKLSGSPKDLYAAAVAETLASGAVNELGQLLNHLVSRGDLDPLTDVRKALEQEPSMLRQLEDLVAQKEGHSPEEQMYSLVLTCMMASGAMNDCEDVLRRMVLVDGIAPGGKIWETVKGDPEVKHMLEELVSANCIQ